MAKAGENRFHIKAIQDIGYFAIRIPVLDAVGKFAGYGIVKAHNQDKIDPSRSTLLMGNHDEGFNHIWVHRAINYELGKDLHTVVKAHILNEETNKLKKYMFRGLIRNFAKGIFIERNDSEDNSGVKAHMREYLKVIKEGKHLLITPTGLTSIDGTIDYTEEKVDYWTDEITSRLLTKINSPFQIHNISTQQQILLTIEDPTLILEIL